MTIEPVRAADGSGKTVGYRWQVASRNGRPLARQIVPSPTEYLARCAFARLIASWPGTWGPWE